MMGMAAGLTIGGKIPFTGTFANFSTGRVYDQIRQSVAYSHKNVKICASHAGVTLGEDGATHQILEDIGLMKMLPGMTVINTCDYNQTKAATIGIADHNGPFTSALEDLRCLILQKTIRSLLSEKVFFCLQVLT